MSYVNAFNNEYKVKRHMQNKSFIIIIIMHNNITIYAIIKRDIGIDY